MHCGKTADRIQTSFGIIGRTGPGMRQVVGCGDRFMKRGIFRGEYLHLCASATKQYNLVTAKGVISLARKVTAGMVESNDSLPLGL